jgi:hypothetical protein
MQLSLQSSCKVAARELHGSSGTPADVVFLFSASGFNIFVHFEPVLNSFMITNSAQQHWHS